MPTRRVFASWLPPNPHERIELIKMRRMQWLVIAWMIGVIPGGWIIVLLAPADGLFVPFTIIWIGIGLWLAGRVGGTRCPRCGGDFCERHELPYWYSLFNRRCENCGLSLSSSPSSRG
jgi:hypothetical protein